MGSTSGYNRSRRWEFLFYGIVIGFIMGLIFASLKGL